MLARFASVDATVLLSGETGTGKELAARAVHYLSARRDNPFVPINCAGIPDGILEAELFGHVKGAFTDATRARPGLIGQAQGGTLFLDEVDSLSPRAQGALLRFVQDHCYRPVGAAHVEHGDVRLIAASNADLEACCRAGQFRQDLLYRLNLLAISLPPLREREGDPLLLAQTFLERFRQQYRAAAKRLDAASIEHIVRYPWPGNVRELEHTLHRAFLLANAETIHLDVADVREMPDSPHAPSDRCSSRSFAEAKARVIAEFERCYVQDVLQEAKGNLTRAAQLAGKERSRFGKLVKKYGLHRSSYLDGCA
jgi:transcriptional regulator with GAF, ATPase, and Fis domain